LLSTAALLALIVFIHIVSGLQPVFAI